MTRKAIVTGHSRGIGAALAALLHAEGWEVLGLSRSAGERVDLADPAALTAWLTGGRLAGFLADAGEVLVINNAGLLGPVGVDGPLDAASTVATGATPASWRRNWLKSCDWAAMIWRASLTEVD